MSKAITRSAAPRDRVGAALQASQGFAPIAAGDARVLILGSLPSRLSIARREYYGNPHNAFWRIMGKLFGASPQLPYGARAKRLRDNGIAVWDVLESSVRPGSMDSAIDLAGARANDFTTFFGAHAAVASVFFNGKTAERLFRRMVLPALSDRADGLCFAALPSTSPAYAAMPFQDKLQRWSRIVDALQ